VRERAIGASPEGRTSHVRKEAALQAGKVVSKGFGSIVDSSACWYTQKKRRCVWD
jgi:hypothetical protein